MSHVPDNVVAFEVLPPGRLFPLVPGAPRVTAAAGELLREIGIIDELGARRAIQVPVERPLTVVVDGRELVTLMTLGAAPEYLVLGFLFNQRLIEGAAAIDSIAVDWDLGTAAVVSRAPRNVSGMAPRLVATVCGQGSVFHELMAQIDGIRLPAAGEARIGQTTLLSVLEVMREHDSIHRHAGSVHSGALFCGPELLVSVEDVGRHNALDTIAGWMVMHGVAGGDKTYFTTGRLTGEVVMKAAQNGIAILVSRNGVSAMGFDVAAKLGMSLFGRASNSRFMCYTGAERLDR